MPVDMHSNAVYVIIFWVMFRPNALNLCCILYCLVNKPSCQSARRCFQLILICFCSLLYTSPIVKFYAVLWWMDINQLAVVFVSLLIGRFLVDRMTVSCDCSWWWASDQSMLGSWAVKMVVSVVSKTKIEYLICGKHAVNSAWYNAVFCQYTALTKFNFLLHFDYFNWIFNLQMTTRVEVLYFVILLLNCDAIE